MIKALKRMKRTKTATRATAKEDQGMAAQRRIIMERTSRI